MIDTVKFKHCLLVQSTGRELVDSEEWRSEHKEIDVVDRNGKPVRLRRWLLVHKLTGLRAYGNEQVLDTFEVSLPRVLFEHNGRLIKSQAEIDCALSKVYDLMDQIGERSEELPKFERVDLVWQYHGDPQLFLAAHQHARHRRIRRDVVTYETGSLTWKGSGRSVCMYDKSLEMLKVPGNVVRVEVRLRRPILDTLFEQNRVIRLHFNRCYEIYRNTLLGFCPSPIPKVSAIAEFLALAEREKWRSAGVSAFDLYCQRLSQRQRRRLQRQMALVRPQVFKIDWGALLPANQPPPPVEITDDLINTIRTKKYGN